MTSPPPVPARDYIRQFPAFLARPAAIGPSGLGAPGAGRGLAAMAVLHVAVLLGIVLPVVQFWQTRFDLPSPDAFGLLPPEMMIPTVVLIAPVLEECLFRGWLTGRARGLWLLACVLAAGLLLYASTQGLPAAWTLAGIVAAAIAGLAGWLVLRRRGVPSWFAAAFPALYYLSAACFTLAHSVNYSSFSAIALPMVLPQLWGALILSYVRMRIGLAASILQHAAANSAVLALAMVSG